MRETHCALFCPSLKSLAKDGSESTLVRAGVVLWYFEADFAASPVSHFACEIENYGADRRKEGTKQNRAALQSAQWSGGVSWRLTHSFARHRRKWQHVRYCDGFTSGPRKEGKEEGVRGHQLYKHAISSHIASVVLAGGVSRHGNQCGALIALVANEDPSFTAHVTFSERFWI